MLEIFDAIKHRRSIRKYQAKSVPKVLIEDVLLAAGWAPSAHNAQPWRFIVLSDNHSKRDLAQRMAESWALDNAKDGSKIEGELLLSRVERFANAPILILACLTTEGMIKQPDEERQKVERDLAIESLGAAMQNLLLAAHAKGLGACWFCAPAFCKETVRKLLKIPNEVEPAALVTMGYLAESPAIPNRKQLGDYCFNGVWGNKF